MNEMKILETERLWLKPPTFEEQKRLYEILMIPEVNKYYLTINKQYKEDLLSWEKQKGIYFNKVKNALNNRRYYWSIFLKETNECIGELSAVYPSIYSFKTMYVSWYIDPKYQSKGYGTEAVKVMLNYLFDTLSILEARAFVATVNTPSLKILEKLGFIKGNKAMYIECTFVEEPVKVYSYKLNKENCLKNS